MPSNMIPKDPVILVSFLNTQLRDHFSSLDAFCEDYHVDKEEILERLKDYNYEYNPELNRFF